MFITATSPIIDIPIVSKNVNTKVDTNNNVIEQTIPSVCIEKIPELLQDVVKCVTEPAFLENLSDESD